jgi:thiol-disulfide isomerase/thioredoxin
MLFRVLLQVTATVLCLAACSKETDGGDAGIPVGEGAIEVVMAPQAPDRGSDRRMMWSPYGKQLPLREAEGGMYAELALGAEGTPSIGLRLSMSPDAVHYDRLFIDLDRDCVFTDSELHETTVTESNNKFWSSFDAVVEIPVKDPATGGDTVNPYPLSLWYVEDPRAPSEDPVIRFARQGWMEGTVELDGIGAVMLVTENVMDGVFGPDDSWALASRDSAADILTPAYARSLDEHAWLFEKAYRVTRVDPSGRRLIVAPFDPGITRAAEIEMNDHLAVDRRAARSGGAVAFLHDFAEAKAMARREVKPLFVDFETTWCGPCKTMDEWVYTADDVVEASRFVVSVKVDGDQHPDLKESFGVLGFPTMLLLSPEGEEIGRASG